MNVYLGQMSELNRIFKKYGFEMELQQKYYILLSAGIIYFKNEYMYMYLFQKYKLAYLF